MHPPIETNTSTPADLTALLTAPAVDVTAGLDLLDLDLGFLEDISDDLFAGRISWNFHATVHRSCDLRISRELAWGRDLVRPWMRLDDGARFARWELGVFTMDTPEFDVGEDLPTFDVQGYDRTALLDRQVGADYSVPSGTTYRQALLDAFTDAALSGVTIEGAAADDVLPVDRSWPLVARNESDPDQTTTPVTWRRIVNDLLRAINFRAVWADASGMFRCEAYRAPSIRPIEFTFDVDETSTILGESRTTMVDRWRTPNRWVFVNTNVGAPVLGAGLYEVDLDTIDPADPMASANRGLDWPSVIEVDVASQAKLVEYGDRRVAEDRRATEVLSVRTGPLPGASHADVFVVADPLPVKVQATEWTFDLSGSDVSWEWEVVS